MTDEQSGQLEREEILIDAYLRGEASAEDLEELAAYLSGPGERSRRVAAALVDAAFIEGWLNAEANPDFVEETLNAAELKDEAPDFVSDTMARLRSTAGVRRAASGRMKAAASRAERARRPSHIAASAAVVLVSLALGGVLVASQKAPSKTPTRTPGRAKGVAEERSPRGVRRGSLASPSARSAGDRTRTSRTPNAPSLDARTSGHRLHIGIPPTESTRNAESDVLAARRQSAKGRSDTRRRDMASRQMPPRSESRKVNEDPASSAPGAGDWRDASYFTSPARDGKPKSAKPPSFLDLRGTRPVPLLNAAGKVIGESARVAVYQEHAGQTHRIDFAHAYRRPVVIMQPLSSNGGHPANARLHEVDAKGVVWEVNEWDHGDGAHASEHAGYLVVEAGVHTLEGGARLEAGHVTVTHRWCGVLLRAGFTIPPVVISQAQTINGSCMVVTRQMRPGRSGFLVRLQEEEANDDLHKAEAVGWVAVGPAHGKTNGRRFEAGRTMEPLTHEWRPLRFKNAFPAPPVLLAGVQTFNGKDVVSLRYRNLTPRRVALRLEEETTGDDETRHAPEGVGYILLEAGPRCSGRTPRGGGRLESPGREARGLGRK
jgi:hypothetical protein